MVYKVSVKVRQAEPGLCVDSVFRLVSQLAGVSDHSVACLKVEVQIGALQSSFGDWKTD